MTPTESARASGWRFCAQWLLAVAAMVLALLLPALWNGFPLIYPDSGGYLARPLLGTLAMGRSALYGAFLNLGQWFDFWPNIVAQAAMIAWLIVLILRTHRLGGKPWLAASIVLVLAFGTSLAIFASQLMPDIFFPATVLALHLLTFRSGKLTVYERAGLFGLIVFAIAAHMAILALAAGLLVALWLAGRFGFGATPALRLPAAAVAAGIMLCPASNYAITGQFAFTPGGSSFLFARLIEDGIVPRYLDERCPDSALRICSYRDELPRDADDWLWKNGTAFYKLGGAEGYGDEERRIIVATLVRYPFAHLATAAADTALQFIAFKSEIVTNRFDNAHAIWTFSELTPHLIGRLKAARQYADPARDWSWLNAVHVPVAALAIAGLAGLLLFARRLALAPEAASFCATVLLALAVNAAVCGIFSHPVDRYQSRLVGLAPLALLVAWLGRRRASTLDQTETWTRVQPPSGKTP